MLYTNVRIIEDGQPSPWPELHGKEHHHCQLDRFAVLQGGMKSGNASVAISVDLPDGSCAFIETSATNFWRMACAMKGACERWGQDLT